MIFHHDISPILFELGPLDIRWYGLMYAFGLGLNYAILQRIFKREGYSLKHLDSLVLWLFVGLVVGSRLGHVFFYEAEYYLANPIEILKIWKGGLASHGGALGLLIAYFLWTKSHKVKFSKYLNAIVVPMPLTAFFVRVGNFFNSEIVGIPTSGNYGVVFKRLGEDFPRHPVQLYEGFMSLFVFGILFLVYKKWYRRMPPLSMMFLYILLYFTGRFFVEFYKDLQGPLPQELGITTGQALSLIPVLIGVIYFSWLFLKKKTI